MEEKEETVAESRIAEDDKEKGGEQQAPHRIVVTASRAPVVEEPVYHSPLPEPVAVPETFVPAPAEVRPEIRPEVRSVSQQPVVTATRVPTPIENVVSPVTVFTGGQPGGSTPDFGAAASYGTAGVGAGVVERGNSSAEIAAPAALTAGNIESRQYRTIADVLQNVPGMALYSTGSPGSQSAVLMRGLNAGNTRVLVDGMPMNDPSTMDSSFDFGLGSLDNLGQFEVLRGQHSTLYGSSATGGVINMTSQKGEGPFKGFLSTEAGSHGTVRTRFGSSAGNEKADFSFAGTLLHTDGFSSTDKNLGNTEKDKFDFGSYNIRLGANVGDNLRLDFFSSGLRDENEVDNWPVDDPYMKARNTRFMIRPQAVLTLFDGAWEQTMGVGYSQTRRKYFDDGNPVYIPVNYSDFKGELFRFDYKSIVKTHDWNTLLFGADVEQERMVSNSADFFTYAPLHFKPDNVTTTGVYIEDQVNVNDTFFVNAGMRYIHHETFGNKITWNAGLMYVLPTKTRIKATAGTGFKAPTLYQLYDPAYGSRDLDAERTFGWDAGLEQSLLGGRIAFGSTFFHNRVKNGIGTIWDGSAYRYYNEGAYWAYGLESFVNVAITDRLGVTANHTWTKTKAFDSGNRELSRRPLHQASVNVDWKFHEKGTFTAGVRYVGKQWDTDPATYGQVRMPSYTVVRAAASWRFNDHLEVFARVENIMNKKYQPLNGFGCEPVSFYGGATISF